MKKFGFTINGNKYDVEIGNIEDNTVEVKVNGSDYDVLIDRDIQPIKTPKLVRPVSVPSTESTPSTQKTAAPGKGTAIGKIKSPLPGVILEMYAREGDTVKVGQKLLVLEAMKMENVIHSDKDGVIVKIPFSKGDNVMEGDVLIEIGE